MLLYLMRHGVAVPRDAPDCPPDPERPLTEEGRRRTREVARGMDAIRIRLDRILTSPLVRARQTAEIVAARQRMPASRFRESRALRPGASPEVLFKELANEDPTAAILLVGHEPDMSALISRLTTGDPNRLGVKMKKAAVCLVEVDAMPPNAPGVLHFLLHPRHLRAIGKWAS